MHFPSFRSIVLCLVGCIGLVFMVHIIPLPWWLTVLIFVGIVIVEGFCCILWTLYSPWMLIRWKQPELYRVIRQFQQGLEELGDAEERAFHHKETHEIIFISRDLKGYYKSSSISIYTIEDEDYWRTSQSLLASHRYTLCRFSPYITKDYSLDDLDQIEARTHKTELPSEEEISRMVKIYLSLPSDLRHATVEEIRSILPYFDRLKSGEFEEMDIPT